jgi:hypothetical protein
VLDRLSSAEREGLNRQFNDGIEAGLIYIISRTEYGSPISLVRKATSPRTNSRTGAGIIIHHPTLPVFLQKF